MKKIIIFILAVIVGVVAKSQTPLPSTQNIGGPTTLVKSLGGLTSNLVFTPPNFSDTTAANIGLYTKSYVSGLIFTSSDTAIWYRSVGANKWIKISGGNGNGSGGGGGGTINALTNGLTLTGATGYWGGPLVQNTVISGAGFKVRFDNLDSFTVRYGTTKRIEVGAISTNLSSPDYTNVVSVLDNGINLLTTSGNGVTVRDTSVRAFGHIYLPNIRSGSVTDSLMVWNAFAGEVKKISASSFGAGSVLQVTSDNFSPVFNVNVANQTTNPHFTFTAQNTDPYKVYWRRLGTSGAAAFDYLDTSAFGGTGQWNTYVQNNSKLFAVEDARASQVRYFSGANAYNLTLDSLQLIVKGVYGSGLSIPSYAGSQMFFNPRKAAFRAGEATGGQWVDVNVGAYSAAFGSTTTASGDYSFAAGISNMATNSGAASFGNDNLSSGSRSFTANISNSAIGYAASSFNDSTIAGGHYSFSAGYGTAVHTESGFVVGRFNDSTEYNSPTEYRSYGRAFQVGGGASRSSRANALTVLFDGRTMIGTVTRDTSALLKMVSTTKGLLMPVMTGVQQNLIPTPSTGLIIYNTDSTAFCYYNGVIWVKIGSGTGGAGTVTQILSGNGMNFSTITGTGTVTLGTPSSVTLASTNSLTSNSHTHAFAPGGTSSQVILGDGTLGTYNGGTGWLTAGNTLVGTEIFGSINNRSVRIYSNGTQKMVVDSNGRVGIGTATPHVSALLNISSTTKGFLKPVVTGVQMNAISTPATGLEVYNTDSVATCFYNGAAWIKVGAATSGTGVTSVATGYGVTGGPITTTGTVVVDTATLFTKLFTTLALTTNGASGPATYNAVTRILNIPEYTSGGGSGTVTLITAGDGMSFSNITTSGAVTMGTPGSVTLSSTNAVATGTHTHAFVPGGTSSQVIAGDGSLLPYTSNAWSLAGNSLAGTEIFGSTSNRSVRLYTNNTQRFVADSNGRFGFGTATPNSTALADFTSTTQGLLMPRLTGIQQAAISSPATGLIIYNTDSVAFCYYTGSIWVKMANAVGGSGTVIAISHGYGVINTPNPITTLGTVKADSARMFPDVLATIAITTTGTSGAATWNPVSRILNIPQYIGGGGGSGVTTLGPIINSSNANGGTISGVTLYLNKVNRSFGGVWTTGADTVAGRKTFSDDIRILGDLSTLNDSAFVIGVGPDKVQGNADTRVGVMTLNQSLAAYSGNNNTAVGWTVLRAATSGYNNTAMGSQSMTATTTGNGNSAYGVNTLLANTTGVSNDAFGNLALSDNTTGNFNAAFGAGALNSTVSANSNSAFGVEAMQSSISGSFNSSFGRASLENNNQSGSSAFGYYSMRANTIGIANAAFGYRTMMSGTTAQGNSGFGYDVLVNNTASFNTAVGSSSLFTNTTGSNNTTLGYATLYSNTTGSFNVAIGNNSQILNTISSYNTSVGYGTLSQSNGGDFNTMMGTNAGRIITLGDQNTGIGVNALYYLTTGNKNVALGAGALENATTASFDVALGQDALLANTTGSGNIGIGWNGGAANIAGNNNISIGYGAAKTPTVSNNNIFIGREAGWHASQATTVTNSIAIGYQSYTTKDNLAVFGANTITETWLRGKTGVNVENPDSNLQVSGGIYGNRGLRLTGLPSSPGIKALRINTTTGVVSYADTSSGSGSGTRFAVSGEDAAATQNRKFTIPDGYNMLMTTDANDGGGFTLSNKIGSDSVYLTAVGISSNPTMSIFSSDGTGISVTMSQATMIAGSKSFSIDNAGYFVFSLPTASSMTSKAVMVWDSVSYRWERISSASIVTTGGGLTAITADNGLTANTSSNVRLGGTLLQNTVITGGAFYLSLTGSSTSYSLISTNSSTGAGIFGFNSSTGTGGTFSSVGGTALIAYSDASVSLDLQSQYTTTNSIEDVMIVDRRTTGTPANGIGGSIKFEIETSTAIATAGLLSYRWTDVTDGSRTSAFSIQNVNSAVTQTVLDIIGSGRLTLSKYGIGTFTGTPAYNLVVDASGNVIEAALTSGTVTSVGFTGGIISVATATTTPAFTVAGTSGGIPYFSSSSTWATSAALAANAIVIGGGAGAAPSTTTTGTGILTFLGTPSSANLRGALTDENGTGVALFDAATSPSFTTSITTGSTTFALLNTTATTVNAFAATTTLNMGASATMILNFGGSTTASEFRFLEPSGAGTNYVGFKAPATLAGNTVYSLPNADGTSGYVLSTNGSGVLSWISAGGGGGWGTTGTVATLTGDADLLLDENTFIIYGGGSGGAPISIVPESNTVIGSYNNTVDDGVSAYSTYSTTTTASEFKITADYQLGSQTAEIVGNSSVSGATITYNAAGGHTFTGTGGLTISNGAGGGLSITSGNAVSILGDWAVLDGGTNITIDATNNEVSVSTLAGTGSRAVLADATGILSAPVSDRSTKQNIQPLENGLDLIMKLKPSTFEFKEGWKNYGEGTQVGFIAQEMRDVLPNSVFLTPSTGKLGITVTDVIPVLTKATQELATMVKNQQQQITELLKRIEKLENK